MQAAAQRTTRATCGECYCTEHRLQCSQRSRLLICYHRIVSSLSYMAPELLTSSDRNPPADIFSLALTLYEICKTAENGVDGTTGKWSLPFEGLQWRQLRRGDLCSNLLQGRGKALSTTLQAAMDPDPTQRPLLSSILHLPDLMLSMTRADPTLQHADWPTANPTLGRVRSFSNLMDELPDKHFSSTSRRFL